MKINTFFKIIELIENQKLKAGKFDSILENFILLLEQEDKNEIEVRYKEYKKLVIDRDLAILPKTERLKDKILFIIENREMLEDYCNNINNFI